jgi:hypothetical protein
MISSWGKKSFSCSLLETIPFGDNKDKQDPLLETIWKTGKTRKN